MWRLNNVWVYAMGHLRCSTLPVASLVNKNRVKDINIFVFVYIIYIRIVVYFNTYCLNSLHGLEYADHN
jgi:hypothetical protein